MAVLHQSMCITKAGHSILRHFRVKHKDKTPMCQISIEILEYDVIQGSSYQNLKICVSQVAAEKNIQD